MRRADTVVTENIEIARNIFQLSFKGDIVKEMKEPGQFLHLRASDQYIPLLRRPISICDVNLEKQECTMLYRADGEGTTLLSEKRQGDNLDVLGPLGNGFPLDSVEKGETALLVGGGIGVPPLYYLSKKLVEKGVKVIHVLGFGSAEDSFYEQNFNELGETVITTIDGSVGFQGFVTDYMRKEHPSYDVLYACGPTPMLNALEQQLHPERAYFSFEERMGCGIGACFACVCHVQGDETGTSYKKVCSDGPVFPVGVIQL
ncbi:dihydroorotate dehydrogenase electron transfer subunit [Alkalihalobacillus sp. AL-G]|uniref:dihydroorotate dehydrogenase electron transfer subunit n=1 Tax=Alkalihalobacillus sp. AL-G TaxID=2926399 RepID=UPI00272D7BD6|nr:dihydroorotate dehydrogenase electron transfer subunit [Alkalihalobacillus sp. AL-G]WLD95094.1 dihydroorotate dehydrogenase electron transfer subunit [Alkalihalobacillus sp. AL-G]